jgi:hypothetical protein
MPTLILFPAILIQLTTLKVSVIAHFDTPFLSDRFGSPSLKRSLFSYFPTCSLTTYSVLLGFLSVPLAANHPETYFSLIFHPSSVAAKSFSLLLHFESLLICSWPAKMFFLTVGLIVSAFHQLISITHLFLSKTRPTETLFLDDTAPGGE